MIYFVLSIKAQLTVVFVLHISLNLDCKFVLSKAFNLSWFNSFVFESPICLVLYW